MNTADYWIDRGWTPEGCRRRMQQCRENAIAFRSYPQSSRFTYRLINRNLYLQARGILRLITQ